MQKTNSNSDKLIDNYGRVIDYLRLAVTDRCNLRCTYCMPEEGISSIPHSSLLTYEEHLGLIKIFTQLGINKLRITGGEPFARKGLINFIENIATLDNSPSIHITTNGVITGNYLKRLSGLKIAGLNISLDTLKQDKFIKITRHDKLKYVLNTINESIEYNIPLKINCVVQNGINDDEIIDIAGLAEMKNIEVRFIEEMPFNGYKENTSPFTSQMIFERLLSAFPNLTKTSNNSTAQIYKSPELKGQLGIIAGYSRSFCSSCNRIRITSTGMFKTCLYDNGVLDLRNLIRSGSSDNEIISEIRKRINNRFTDGIETETFYNKINKQSMASIGG